MTLIRILMIVLLLAGTASANCVNLNVATWTPEQRTYFKAVATALAGEKVDVAWVTTDEQKPDPQVGQNVRLCAKTADLSSLSSATMQTQAQALYVAQAADDAAKAAEKAEIETELNTSQFCKTATFAQIASRIATQKAAVATAITTARDAAQSSINAVTNIATAKEAMTLMNTAWSVAETELNDRVWAAFEKAFKCTIGPQRLVQP